MELSGILTTAIGFVTLIQPTFANVGSVCSANGNECAGLDGGYCVISQLKCACAKIYADDGATMCTPKACTTGDATVCTDANSVCFNSECACKAKFELTGADDSDTCVAMKIGSSCTAEGGECADISGSVCDTSGQNLVCACPATYTANEDGNACVANELGSSCTADGGECAGITNSVCDISVESPVCACPTTHTENTGCVAKACSENTECATPDVNAECSNEKCGCKVTFEISKSKLCEKKVIGSSCTTDGGECANIAGAVCDNSGESQICGCPTTHTANADGSQCTVKSNANGPAVSVILLFTSFLSKSLRQF